MQTLLEKPKYLANACASTYIKYLAQSLVHMAVRGRKEGNEARKGEKGGEARPHWAAGPLLHHKLL